VQPNEVNDYPSELFAPVFLEEVTAAFDDRVRLTLGAAHPFVKDLLAASGDGISVAESGMGSLLNFGWRSNNKEKAANNKMAP